MSTSTPAQLRRLLFGALTGPVAWSVYFLAGYSLVEGACRLPPLTAPPGAAGLSAVSVVVLVLTLVTVLVTLYAGWLAYAHWRWLEGAPPADPRLLGNDPPVTGRATGTRVRPAGLDRDTERLMAVGGILLNGLFAFLTIVTGLPAVVLAPCG